MVEVVSTNFMARFLKIAEIFQIPAKIVAPTNDNGQVDAGG